MYAWIIVIQRLDATVDQLNATVDPLNATVDPLKATVDPLNAKVNPMIKRMADFEELLKAGPKPTVEFSTGELKIAAGETKKGGKTVR